MVSVIIPTYNAEKYLPDLLNRLKSQTIHFELIIIDSTSTDNTQSILRDNNIDFYTVPSSSFNHGGTRNLGVSLAKHEIIVMLTQDALPYSNTTIESLKLILESDPIIGMAYGRQLPYDYADKLSQFARLTNYPPQSRIKTKEDISYLGIRTCHCSNSFAAYKRKSLLAVGGFPTDNILGEDVIVGAKMIMKGLSLAYSADAKVIHSHNYTINEEFKRYFDIGAFHQQGKGVLEPFTGVSSEGIKYVISEWQFLIRHNHIYLIPVQLLRTLAKFIGYRLGRINHYLPLFLKKSMSMHRNFWK